MYVVIEDFELCLGWEGQGQCFYSMSARQKIIQKIIETHVHGEILEKVKAQLVEDGVDNNWSMHADGSVRFNRRSCVQGMQG